jgi:hypothetical protein
VLDVAAVGRGPGYGRLGLAGGFPGLGLGPVLGQHDHRHQVGDQADAVGERQQHGRDADDGGIDAQPPRHARADARHHAVVAVTGQALGKGEA